MSAKKRRNPKLATYNYLLKEFSKANKLLPDERRLSLKQAREFVSNEIYPLYKDVSKSKIGKRALASNIATGLERLAAASKKRKNPKLAAYNHLLKEFSEVNKLLPEDRKLSLKEAREFVSNEIYPFYKETPIKKIGKRALKSKIIAALDKKEPKVGCDPNLIDPEVYRSIDVFGIDEYLQQIVPNCIYVKVNGGEFGETKIFNTRNYSYGRSGVRDIIENIRKYVDEISSDLEWSGVQQLKPRKPNDGTPENYYIEFILFIGGDPVSEKTATRKKPTEKTTKKAASDVTNVIRERINNLRAKKRKKTRVKKSVSKAAKKIKTIKKRITTIKTEKTKDKYIIQRTDVLLKELNKLKRAYEKGLLNKQEYQKLKDRLSSEFEKGGEI